MPASKTPSTDNWPEIRRQSEAALPKEIVEHIAKVRAGEHPESQLIGVLPKVQAQIGRASCRERV